MDYLSRLVEFPVFRNLQTLEPVEETWIDAEVRGMLEREVAELAARARRREIPEPPEWVGLEGTGTSGSARSSAGAGSSTASRSWSTSSISPGQMGMELWALPND